MKAQLEYMHISARSAPIFYAQSVLINKISASELSRKFIKSALLVGNEGSQSFTCRQLRYFSRELRGGGERFVVE